MSPRHFAWIAVVVLVALPVGYFGIVLHLESQVRDRTNQSETGWRNYLSVIGGARPSVIDKLARIRAELARGGAPDWAGEYAWSNKDSLSPRAPFEQCNIGEGLVLAPKEGAVWWSGGLSPESAMLVDCGRVLGASDDHVMVEWTIDPVVPHRAGIMLPVRLLASDLERVKWDGGDFLVPSVRMPLFCSRLRATMKHVVFLAPRRGGWEIGDGSLNFRVSPLSGRPTPQPPIVPSSWRDYIASNVIEVAGKLELWPEVQYAYSDADLVGTRWFPWKGNPDLEDGVTRTLYAVDGAAAKGLHIGMPFFHPNDHVSLGIVVGITSDRAHVEFWSTGDAFDSTRGPPDNVTLSTRAPWEP